MPNDLNSAQQEAVSTLKGPLLVLAGAGTGKTRVVTTRIAELIRRRTKPERILAVTFTNRAATEMQHRAAALLGRKLPAKPQISTFHSLCVRILRKHIPRLGYPQKFGICDRGDQEAVARKSLREINVPNETMRPGDLLYFIGKWKTRGVSPDSARQAATDPKEDLAAAGYRRYQNALRASGTVDFDDLLLLTEELFERFADVRQVEAARFDHLLVDEYQDTNDTQYRIIKAMAEKHRNLCVVGDDDQSIYAWRGADVTHILGFQRDWPDAKVVRLEDNYRSRPEIIELANTLIAYNLKRHDKTLRPSRPSGEKPRILQFQDETEEARQVVADIKKVVSEGRATLRQIAILLRTNEQPRAFEIELRRSGVPYVLVGGKSFYDRREVRDVLAFLKVIAQPSDEVSLLRIINTPARGISQATVATMMEEAVRRGCPLWDILCDPAVATLLGPAAEAVDKFRQLIEAYRVRMEQGKLVDLTRELFAAVNYRLEIDRLYKEPADQEARWQSVEEVVNSVGSYEKSTRKPTLAGFLEETALAGREQEADKEAKMDRDAVVLLTLHSAKGLEFPHVYLVGLEEGLLPHLRSISDGDKAIDEERRLCYVGVTRAQDRLTLTMALTRQKWGKPRPSLPSRFLYELTGQADHPNAEAARRGERPPAANEVRRRSVKRPRKRSKTARARPAKTPKT